MKNEIVKFLNNVQKPARYIAVEQNFIKKEFNQQEVKIALAFPDLYEIGMSNIGLRILYNILNNQNGIVAERVFTPWFDAEKLLKELNLPLFSLESQIPIKEFDILGFSIHSELSYTNVLYILDLARIEFFSKERKKPLVIAGGPCTVNPEPLYPFIDIFIIGEGEEVILEFINVYKKYRHLPKEELIKHLVTQIEGLYAPSFYEVEYTSVGEIKKFFPIDKNLPVKIKKRIVYNLDKAYYPTKDIIPLVEVVHDRAHIELQRGCTQGCRFCQAGFIYRPSRERSIDTIIKLAKKIIKNSGYSELCLTSLSSGDYSKILTLLKGLSDLFNDRVSIALPSLKVDVITKDLLKYLSILHRSGLTLAPEAGTERLRKIINKKIKDEDLSNAVEEAFSLGWNLVKLYFMFGLPTEKEEDLCGIVELVNKLRELAIVFSKKNNTRPKRLKINISAFVPKPHTPFQWIGQLQKEELYRRKGFLITKLKTTSNLTFGFHNIEMSFYEAVFARGDRRLAQVVFDAYKLGAKFDNWTDYLNLSAWERAFKINKISPEFYANRNINLTEILPWDHIDVGVSKEYLIEEFKKSDYTFDCKQKACNNCGVCRSFNTTIQKDVSDKIKEKIEPLFINPPLISKAGIGCRIRYRKQGKAIYISHLDTLRAFQRALLACDLPVGYTCGYNRRILVSAPIALPLGIPSRAEFIDIRLTELIPKDELINKLNKALPEGIEVYDATKLSSAKITGFLYEACIKGDIEYINKFIVNKTDENIKYLKVTEKKVNNTAVIEVLLKTSINPKRLLEAILNNIYQIECIERKDIIFEYV